MRTDVTVWYEDKAAKILYIFSLPIQWTREIYVSSHEKKFQNKKNEYNTALYTLC